MYRSKVTVAALLLGGLYAPLIFAATSIPVVDRSDSSQGSVTSSVAGSPVLPVRSAPAVANVALSANTELFVMIDQLQEEIRFLRGQVEEQQHQLQRMQQDQRDRYRDLDRRLSLLSQRPVAVPSALPSALPPSLAPATPVVTPKVDPQSVAPSNSDAQAYKDAFALVRERNFDTALTAFDDFLQRYPDSDLTANVLYWMGEVYRAKPSPDQEKARVAYQKLVSSYSTHPKAADAYYKLGLTYQELGQFDKARSAMAKVIELFPNQAPATMAREFLKQQR